MNVDLMLRVAGAVEREPERFSQARYGFNMDHGGASCVAGWAVAIGGGRRQRRQTTGAEVFENARRLLALTRDGALRLFASAWPARWYARAGLQTHMPAYIAKDPRTRIPPLPEDAVAIIRGMAADGCVWE